MLQLKGIGIDEIDIGNEDMSSGYRVEQMDDWYRKYQEWTFVMYLSEYPDVKMLMNLTSQGTLYVRASVERREKNRVFGHKRIFVERNLGASLANLEPVIQASVYFKGIAP